MRFLIPIFLVMTLLGCGSRVDPPPSPVPSANAIAAFGPGQRTITNPHLWNTKVISPEVTALFRSFKTPDDVSSWMLSNLEWRDDYDTTYFLASQEVFDSKRAVCSGLARFSRDALSVQGYAPKLIAFWGTDSAHAVTIFPDETGRYRLFSNQYYTPKNDLGYTLDQALVKAAEAFYGSSWRRIDVYEDGGIVTQRVTNEKLAGPIPANGVTSRNIFRLSGPVPERD